AAPSAAIAGMGASSKLAEQMNAISSSPLTKMLDGIGVGSGLLGANATAAAAGIGGAYPSAAIAGMGASSKLAEQMNAISSSPLTKMLDGIGRSGLLDTSWPL